MKRDYRPQGQPVTASPWEREQGVTPTTADGSLLDANGNYLTAEPDDEY